MLAIITKFLRLTVYYTCRNIVIRNNLLNFELDKLGK